MTELSDPRWAEPRTGDRDRDRHDVQRVAEATASR